MSYNIMMRSDHKMRLEKLRGEVSIFGQQYKTQLDDMKQQIRRDQSIGIEECEKLMSNFQDRIEECVRAVEQLSIDSVAVKVPCR